MDEVGITATQATKDVKKYLRALFAKSGMSQEKVVSSIEQILKTECKADEKHLVHMQLFLHLPYPELEKIHDRPDDFVFLVPPPGFPGLPPNEYCHLIISGDMVHHFMQMALVLRNQGFIKELITQVTSLVLKDEEKCKKYGAYVLIMLAKICRLQAVEKNASESEVLQFFITTFSKFLDEILELKAIPRCEKLTVFMRLVGVSCMQQSDYQGVGSDLVELIEEWSYDLTNRVAKKTYDYFQDLYHVKEKVENNSAPVKMVLLLASQALMKLQVTEQEEQDWAQTSKTSRMTWQEFIGVHAFLTNSILEKYLSEIDEELLNNLMVQTSKWAQHKPKLTREDFQGEIGDFGHFVLVMKRFGDKERDRQVLLAKFLDFSYPEVFLTKDGLKIADKYLVPGADFKTAIGYIKKAMCVDSIAERIVPEKIKVVVLRLMLCNPEVKNRKEELVAEIFKNGTSPHFALANFAMDINQVCSQIGSFEKDIRDANQIEHNEDIIYHICFQNPVEAINCLMKHSFRSQHYKVLCMAKPFLKLPSGPISRKPQRVMNFCFQKLVESTEESNPFFECLVKSVPEMVVNQLISDRDIYQILKKSITELILSNVLLLGKVSKLFSMIDSFVAAWISKMDKELMMEIYNFIHGMSTFTTIFTNKKTVKNMLEIRRKCLKIEKQLLDQMPDQLLKISENEEELKKLMDFTLYEMGLLYIRLPQLREHITGFLKNPDNQSRVPYEKLQNHIINWVLNSEPELEWKGTMDFITEVLLMSYDNLPNLNPVQLFNDCLHAANKTSFVKESPSIIRQYLKFYKRCIQYCWERETFSKEDQVMIVENFVSLSMNMFDAMKKRKSSKERVADDTSIQQVLLLMLEVLNWVVGKNEDFEGTLKETLLDVVLLLPQLKGKCEPIRKCILDRVLKQKNARMIPLPDVVNSSRQEIVDRTLAVDVFLDTID